jgi:cobalt-precorrin 5A hydrolase
VRFGVISITEDGHQLAEFIAGQLEATDHLIRNKGEKVTELLRRHWQSYDGFICIMATGIVVRSIAPLIADKKTDPCIIVCDQQGFFVISLLSGHLGGGNALAIKIAAITGGQAVITTASDTLGLVALDLWARDNNLTPPKRIELTALTTRLVNQKKLSVYCENLTCPLPKGLVATNRPEEAEIIISNKTYANLPGVQFYPQNLVVGIGCNRGTPRSEFEDALAELFSDLQLSSKSIKNLASIDKKNDEIGLLEFAEKNCWSIEFFDKSTINSQNNLEISFAALKAVGAIGVAEPAALLSAKSNLLISRKRKWKNVTMAVAQAPFTL